MMVWNDVLWVEWNSGMASHHQMMEQKAQDLTCRHVGIKCADFKCFIALHTDSSK